jgi:hypothetical protein
VVASTISIAVPTLSSDSSDSSGGGCVYNPNAPARFIRDAKPDLVIDSMAELKHYL